MKKQNKGEWSEFVAKLNILATPTIRLLDIKNASKTQTQVRSIQIGNKMYSVIGKSVYETVYKSEKSKPDNRFVCFSEDIRRRLPAIYEALKKGKRSFRILEAEKLAEKFGFDTSCDVEHNKGDVTLTFIDQEGYTPPNAQKVSLKSFIGDNPTLLNSSINSTRISFKITSISEQLLLSLQKNNFKARENICALVERNAEFKEIYFSDTMENNLSYLNAREQLAFAVLSHFTKNTKSASKMNLLETLAEDKMSFKNAIQSVLRASLVGMNPSSYWDGTSLASDNLLIALPDATCEVLMGKNTLENYLYDHCYIDSPSQTKHKYGKIYKKEDSWYIDLNFQIRVSKTVINVS